jgi:glycosyltransferase involved in cell wall biosynthesis
MNQPLKVLEVTKSTGGVGSYIRWLANGIDRERYQLTVACLSEGGPELAADLNRIPGVRAFSVAMNRYKLDPRSDLGVLFSLGQLLRRERFDLIHAHTSKPGYLARLAALGTGIPVIYRPACFAFHDQASAFRKRYSVVLERLAARHMTARIMAVCNDERELGLRNGVGTPEQIVTIHTGIDPRPFGQAVDRAALRAALGVPADVPLVGVVGRLSAQKAPLDFVRAAARVHAAMPVAHYVWVGDGELEPQARALVAELGLDTVFHFAGLRRDVPALLQAFDIFTLPSHWEGFSLSVLEAMAAGLPIVATRVTGTAEAIAHGESGLLVPMGDDSAMAAAIFSLLADPERARGFGQAGRRRIDELFTRERMIRRISELYDQVSAEYGRKRQLDGQLVS